MVSRRDLYGLSTDSAVVVRQAVYGAIGASLVPVLVGNRVNLELQEVRRNRR